MDNPNEYDDEGYANAANDLNEAVYALWEAGASKEEVQSEFENALSNIG